jgi:hypothetical protein
VNDALFDDWYAAGTLNETTAATLKPFVFEDGGVQILPVKLLCNREC